MNLITGKVILKETGIGIPDLLVEVYDIDPTPGSAASGGGVIDIGDRLGSVLTDRAGLFRLEYDDAQFQVRDPDEKRPDLSITVRAPDEDRTPNLLHITKDIRQKAGVNEAYVIRIPTESLASGGVSAPNEMHS